MCNQTGHIFACKSLRCLDQYRLLFVNSLSVLIHPPCCKFFQPYFSSPGLKECHRHSVKSPVNIKTDRLILQLHPRNKLDWLEIVPRNLFTGVFSCRRLHVVQQGFLATSLVPMKKKKEYLGIKVMPANQWSQELKGEETTVDNLRCLPLWFQWFSSFLASYCHEWCF